jgi:hypothetical protein
METLASNLDRTLVLARTGDFVAAQHLVEVLHAAGLYARTDAGTTQSVFGVEPPGATVMIAERHRAAAFAELESVRARAHRHLRGGREGRPA